MAGCQSTELCRSSSRIARALHWAGVRGELMRYTAGLGEPLMGVMGDLGAGKSTAPARQQLQPQPADTIGRSRQSHRESTRKLWRPQPRETAGGTQSRTPRRWSPSPTSRSLVQARAPAAIATSDGERRTASICLLMISCLLKADKRPPLHKRSIGLRTAASTIVPTGRTIIYAVHERLHLGSCLCGLERRGAR